jgi:hypothetical protein
MSSNNFPKKLADNVTMYSADPIIYVVHDFLSKDECVEFINIAKKIGPKDINFYRVNHDESDLLHETSKRLSILVQTPIRNAEKYLVTTLSKQTIPTETIDSFNPETQSELMKKDSGGQRLLSLIGVLDEKDCSEVTFSKLNLNIKLQTGEILVLHNCYEESILPNPKSKYTIRATNNIDSWYLKLIFRERLIK